MDVDRWGAMGLRRELEARLLGGDFRGVMDRAAELLSPSMPGSAEEAWGAVMACRAAGALREWGKAIAWAERGLGLAPDAEATGWLNLLLGTALMYTGDALRSERCLRAFLGAAPGHPALARLVPDGLFNLAHLMRYRDTDPATEAACFRQAAAEYAARGRFSQVLLCQTEAAWSYLTAGKTAEALPELEAATAGLAQHGDPTLQVYVQICWAFYWRLAGDFAQSQAICEELQMRSEMTAGQRADVAWLLGSNARSLGDATAAAGWAEKAYEQALEDLWPLQIRRIEELRSSVPANPAGR